MESDSTIGLELIARKLVQAYVNDKRFEEYIKGLFKGYFAPTFPLTLDDVEVIWVSRFAGGWKAFLTTRTHVGRFYDVTQYDDMRRVVIDVYDRVDQVKFDENRTPKDTNGIHAVYSKALHH